MRDGVRLYSVREQHRDTVDGTPVLVTQRLTKRLVDGRWATVYETERVRPVEQRHTRQRRPQPSILGRRCRQR
jgi:hypothetical protein